MSVIPVNCLDLKDSDIYNILGNILYEFPIKEIDVNFPLWINSLPLEHWLRAKITDSVKDSCQKINKIRDINQFKNSIFCLSE